MATTGRLVSVMFLAVFCSSAAAQSLQRDSIPLEISAEYGAECGSPAVESMAWASIEGRVTKLISGNRFVLLTVDQDLKEVSLAGIENFFNARAARKLLSNLILNQRVSVNLHPRTIDSKKITGVVRTKAKDVNRELIAAGLVRYQPAPGTMSQYTACVYRIAEKQARAASRGFWASNAR